MYYLLSCPSSLFEDNALMVYTPDTSFRTWMSGARFETPPPEPVRAEVMPEYPGVIPEFTNVPVPLMTKRLHEAMLSAGVSNLDVYRAEIYDPTTDITHDTHVAFNVIGVVAAADLDQSVYDPTVPGRMISMDFSSVVIDEGAAQGALLFRLAQSVNAVIVHERVKEHIEAQGIDTLAFLDPTQCAT